jgi:hypothetical protein
MADWQANNRHRVKVPDRPTRLAASVKFPNFCIVGEETDG